MIESGRVIVRASLDFCFPAPQFPFFPFQGRLTLHQFSKIKMIFRDHQKARFSRVLLSMFRSCNAWHCLPDRTWDFALAHVQPRAFSPISLPFFLFSCFLLIACFIVLVFDLRF